MEFQLGLSAKAIDCVKSRSFSKIVMFIKNIDETAQRVQRAAANQEKIILFADADLDGVCSLIILEETIKSIGGKVAIVYFPDRDNEGYGLNAIAVDFLKRQSPALLITLDCGIGNFQEVKDANTAGLEVIIIDHHQVLGNLPEGASLIVNPKQPADSYPFKNLANTGIVYYLAKTILAEGLSPSLNQSFLELAALATIADMMEEQADNKMIIDKGLATFLKTARPGLKVLVDLLAIESKSVRAVAQKIVAVLNITELANHLPKSYNLLTAIEEKQGRSLAAVLFQKSQERYLAITNMVSEVDFLVNESELEGVIIFAGNPVWPQVLTGAVASRICNKYQKPTFVFKVGLKVSRGSVRTPKGVDGVEALKSCHEFLSVYGGHAQAAGFTCSNGQTTALKSCLESYFKNKSKYE